MRLRSIGIFLFAALLPAGCVMNTAFQESKTLPSSGWAKEDTVVFKYETADTAGLYDIIVDIRNSGDYRSQNFWLFINSTSPDSDIFKDTLECVLADNYGKWIGSGSGSLYQLPVSFMQQIKFPVTGTYTFNLIQGMRTDTLKGIHDIGLRIMKSR